MATRIPGDLIDPAPPYHVEASPHRWPTDIVEKHEIALIKLRLLLVCRSWRQMATEFLYENVRIYQRFDRQQSTRARALRWTLEATATVRDAEDSSRGIRSRVTRLMGRGLGVLSSDVGSGYGRWVKQLAFHVDCLSVEDAAAIVGHCPNVLTLILSKGNAWEPDQLESIFLPAIPQGLRRMELLRSWSSSRPPVYLQEFSNVLRKQSSIIAASLDCNSIDFGPSPSSPCQLQALTLILPETSHLISLEAWKLPSLTHLTLEQTVVSSELLSVLMHFGPQLLFLDISPGGHYARDFFLQLCSKLSNSCRRLRGFVLHDDKILPDNLHSQSLTHLVIPTRTGWDSKHTQMRNALVSKLPALKCIRVLAGRDPLNPLFPPNGSMDWVVDCRARGIRVEDEDGLDLLDPHYPVKIIHRSSFRLH
jgi:hypothetical protein